MFAATPLYVEKDINCNAISYRSKKINKNDENNSDTK
jgi:hypothetical protein